MGYIEKLYSFLPWRDEIKSADALLINSKIHIFVTMLRIVTHIENLLLEHDCVILPDFGGFVLQAVPSVYDKENNRFLPMRKEVMFNSTLRYADGLLCGSYMQRYGVDYAKARLMMEEDIDSLSKVLEHDKSVTLGKIGSFTKGDEGQVIFMPGDSSLLNADAYGLPAFEFPLLPVIERVESVATTKKKESGDILYIPVSRRFIRIAAASAAAVALFFLSSTPIKDVNRSTYRASFVPSEMITTHFEKQAAQPFDEVLAEAVVEEPKVELEAKPAVEPAKVEAAAPVVAKPASVAAVKEAKSAKPERKREAVAKKMYHVIIASFPSQGQADEYISKVDRKLCGNVNIVLRDGKYRVYADRFDNRRDAENYMATIRKSPSYKDAWIFISR